MRQQIKVIQRTILSKTRMVNGERTTCFAWRPRRAAGSSITLEKSVGKPGTAKTPWHTAHCPGLHPLQSTLTAPPWDGPTPMLPECFAQGAADARLAVLQGGTFVHLAPESTSAPCLQIDIFASLGINVRGPTRILKLHLTLLPTGMLFHQKEIKRELLGDPGVEWTKPAGPALTGPFQSHTSLWRCRPHDVLV